MRGLASTLEKIRKVNGKDLRKMPYSRATFRYEPDKDESDGDEVGELKNIKTKQNVFLGYNVSSPAKTAVSG